MYSKNKEGSVNRNFTVVLMWKLGNVERTTEEFYYFITSPWSSHLNQLDPLILFSPIHFPAFLLPPSAWTEMVSSVSLLEPHASSEVHITHEFPHVHYHFPSKKQGPSTRPPWEATVCMAISSAQLIIWLLLLCGRATHETLCHTQYYSPSKWKWKSLSHVWLFRDPMGCQVHGILQVRILDWVAFPFSMGSPQLRHRTQVSCIAGRFLTSWATREAQEDWSG